LHNRAQLRRYAAFIITNKMQKVMYVAVFFTEIFRPLLQLMNVDHGFLKADPNSWQQHTSYIAAHSL